MDDAEAGGNEVTQGVSGVVSTGAVIVGIDFENIFRAGGIVLEVWWNRPVGAPAYMGRL